VEALFDLFLWSMAGMLALAPLGAGFGAVARVVAQQQGSTPDATPADAVRRGAVSGAMFLGVVGLLFGLILGFRSESFESGIGSLALVAGGVLALMLMAGLFAGLGHFFAWLGVRGTGLLLMLVIVLGFAVVKAHKAGFDWQPVAWTAGTLGLAGTALIVVLRIRSPQGSNAFGIWAEDADVIEE
jgi:hypothetical protein